jgi:hypothetical protein
MKSIVVAVTVTVTAILGASLSNGFQVNYVHHPKPPHVVVSPNFPFPYEQQHRDLKSTQVMQSEQSLNLYQSKNGASPGYRVPQKYET